MNKVEHPIQSFSSLLKSLILAVFLALVILITAVLPAEYGIDLTGAGKMLGLTALAEPSTVEPVQSGITSCVDTVPLRKDVVKLKVPANNGLEYKFHLEKGVSLEYSWRTSGLPIYFDFHGEPQGDTTGYFKSYKESSLSKDSGSKEMPFTGSHGWYWKNESDSPVTVYLETKGEYQVIGLR